MDKRMQEILENFEKNSLGLDDTFQFKCRECGKCCKNREDILLTARDLYNIARELGRTTEYVVERYCEIYIGSGSRMPIVRLRPTGPEKACPLLRDKKCIVHRSKPVVCALFPLGRATGMQIADNGTEKPERFLPRYFVQPATCGTQERTHTVRSWLEYFGIPVEDEFYELWTEAVTFIAEFFHSIEAKEGTGKAVKILWNITISELYINYDPSKEIIPQFRVNMEKLRDVFAKVTDMANELFGGLPDGE